MSLQCLAGDTLNQGEKIKGNETTLVSAGKKFELGFFSPSGSASTIGGTGRYLGIWYHMQEGSEPQTQIVVWVANRDYPVAVDSTGVFQIADDGNLVVSDTSGKSYWSSELNDSSSSSTNKRVRLNDSGNLELVLDEQKGMKLWESFEHPTDTFLYGMKMDKNLKLTSWRSPQDPAQGNFTFKMAQTRDNRYVISNHNQLYWESDEVQEAKGGDDMNNEVYNFLTAPNRSLNYDNKRLFINSTGFVQFLLLNNQKDFVSWFQPNTTCMIYNYCGNFASCNDNSDRLCKCLPGFDYPRFMFPRKDYEGQRDSTLQDWRCNRKSASCGKDTTFLNFVMVKMRSPDQQVTAESESECKSMCLNMCPKCQAYSYTYLPRRDSNIFACWIWTQNLTTLKEEYLRGDGRNISVRVAKSDIAPTPNTCEPCGTTLVPYPLSTGLKCGDPTYFKFICNNSTGQLSFLVVNDSYRVISIEPVSRKFSIRTNFSRRCNLLLRGNENLLISSPFNNINEDECSDRVEINWEPPSEPSCVHSLDCHGWNHSTCKGEKCLCDANYYWHGNLLSCTQKAISPPNSTSEEPSRKGSPKSLLSLILGTTLTGVVTLACIIVFAYACRRKIALGLMKDREHIRRNRGRFYDSERHVKDLIGREALEEKDNEGVEVPYFDFESILEATNHFSNANKIGKGGYGQVYKGKLQCGEDIAVKRLSVVSSQGLQEFKNEVVLIAKLQHRNLVRLRGYCIKEDEKILLYEYMPNRSLDSFIFDSTKSVLLDWPMRFDIILGVARGLLYLHQDSRLRVIHRDLKTSNILLDVEMQPKISDFGLARIFGGKDTEASTQRVVGTFGYMPPEYALYGLFSTKLDVFSFGVVLLEIISGKRNTGFFKSNESSSLLDHAWRLWKENRLLDLMDLSLHETCNANQLIRCAHIGLLCVQDEPDNRPTMSNVVIMLDSETASLSNPKQPTFFKRRDLSSTTSSSLQLRVAS
ncbi:G-type lectin S-receptor-like serine/threonine-protein kinase At4g03230 isoform X2 [Abrus precatorius]|uniref:non-specific serine/threonine protein kinase n=1 Tax=Abrus precatorius TaxID=3816 RepID=A0A8B8KX64_ABRPR|nr:G-type lectin S-receptor-like serine/threonine-protein kinase At4g03230 isoform X2 [Abrus precatorius]